MASLKLSPECCCVCGECFHGHDVAVTITGVTQGTCPADCLPLNGSYLFSPTDSACCTGTTMIDPSGGCAAGVLSVVIATVDVPGEAHVKVYAIYGSVALKWAVHGAAARVAITKLCFGDSIDIPFENYVAAPQSVCNSLNTETVTSFDTCLGVGSTCTVQLV